MGDLKPKLADALEMLRIGPERFAVRDPRTGERFEIDDRERFLMSLMDGRHELAAILDAFQTRYEEPLRRRFLREFVEQLRTQGLLAGEEAAEEATLQPLVADGDLRFAEAPRDITVVTALFDVLVLLLGWLIHPVWIPVLVAGAMVAAMTAFHEAGAFVRYLEALSGASPIPLVIVIVGLKFLVVDLVFAVLMGIACRKLGGRVESFNFVVYHGLLPTWVCNIGESAAWMERSERWKLLLLRPLFDMALATVAILGWNATAHAPGLRDLFTILLLPALVGMVMQFNVFSKLNGYRILSYWISTPQLYERARAQAAAFWLPWRTAPEAMGDWSRLWMRVYGTISLVLTPLQSVLIFGGIFWLFIQQYQGLGAFCATAIVVLWYRGEVVRVAGSTSVFQSLGRMCRKWWVRWPIRIALLCLLIALGFIPYSYEISGECRLLPHAQQGVRAQVADEIVTVHVNEGDWVEAGDPIVTLSGREIAASLDAVAAELEAAKAQLALLEAGTREEEIEIARQEIKRWDVELTYQETELARIQRLIADGASTEEELDRIRRQRALTQQSLALAKSELSLLEAGSREEEIAVARAQIRALEARRDYDETQKGLLEIRSPIAGRVVTPYLSQRLGQTTEEGDLIAVVQNEHPLRVEIAADQAATVMATAGMTVKVRLTGLDGELIHGRVTGKAPFNQPQKDFGADPFRTDREIYIEQSLERQRDEYFTRVYADLEPTDLELAPGMTGYARIVVGQGILWSAIWRPIGRFLRTEVWSWLP